MGLHQTSPLPCETHFPSSVCTRYLLFEYRSNLHHGVKSLEPPARLIHVPRIQACCDIFTRSVSAHFCIPRIYAYCDMYVRHDSLISSRRLSATTRQAYLITECSYSACLHAICSSANVRSRRRV